VGKPSLNAAQPYAKAEGRVFLLVPAYPGCPGTKAVKRLLLLLFIDANSVVSVLARFKEAHVRSFQKGLLIPFIELVCDASHCARTRS